tara:strand:- start:244 stop:609 length:366 start_codon:yes stop_codon:yes gene_type:complete
MMPDYRLDDMLDDNADDNKSEDVCDDDIHHFHFEETNQIPLRNTDDDTARSLQSETRLEWPGMPPPDTDREADHKVVEPHAPEEFADEHVDYDWAEVLVDVEADVDTDDVNDDEDDEEYTS